MAQRHTNPPPSALHRWETLVKLLKPHAGQPYRFHQVRQTLIAEVRSRMIVLLENPTPGIIQPLQDCVDSLERLQTINPADFPEDRQLELAPLVSRSGVVA